jgi:hypothetical protein
MTKYLKSFGKSQGQQNSQFCFLLELSVKDTHHIDLATKQEALLST